MAKKQADRLDALKGMDEGRLREELVTLKKEQFNLRFQQATGQLEKTDRVRVVRRDIARVKTLLRSQAQATADAG
ncbi:MAG: 50S ribosomal protein L29 [Pseudomonadota bacterium]